MKFPRTYHLPWSPGKGKDDKVHAQVPFLLNRPIVITEKLDGENQCWTYSDFHLRSEDSKGGALRSFSKGYWASIRHELIPGYFYFVEDISNVHSIKYPDMSNKLFLIAICDTIEPNTMTWLSWHDVEYEATRIGLPTVPVLHIGEHSTIQQLITNLATLHPTSLGGNIEWTPGLISKRVPEEYQMEGVVVRQAKHFDDWTAYTAKYVRKNHVQSDSHWLETQLKKKWQREKSKNEVKHD